MNKFFAALMTLMIAGTVAVVFVLGVLSVQDGPRDIPPEQHTTTEP
jgi:hypothetical protein